MAVFDPMHSLARDLTDGRIARRDFIKRAAALGFSATAIAGVLAACGASDVPAVATTVASVAPTAAAVATAAASTAPTVAATRAAGGASTATASGAATATRASGTPASGVGGVPLGAVPASPGKRGGGGTLKLLYWQAPTVLNTHLAQGTKDQDASRLVYEPLATIDGDGKFIPVLASEIPSPTNGGLSADQKTVTWKLKQGVKWSDGQPFTADDVVFTFDYATDPATAATSLSNFVTVASVQKVDDLTVKVNFKDITPGWFVPFFGALGNIMPKHIFQNDKGAAARNSPNNLKPVGTGPYKVTSFAPGDAVTYAINENYREPNKPFFDAVQLKGGGDATSAARAVLQTGDYDYAWNLQVEDTILKQLETGGKGVAGFLTGGGIERLLINFTDPNKEVEGERSSLKAPHPFLTDPQVRQALALACDRKTISDSLYGRAGEPGVNLLYDPPQYRSKNNTAEFNLDKANALLDAAGYVRGADGYRAKSGVQLSVLYQTTVNSVRQKTQQLVKDSWEKLGVKTELKSIDAGVYFSSDAGNPDTAAHFYADIEMYTSSNTSPDPQSYMSNWLGENAETKANQWSKGNRSRWQNAEYDQAWNAAKSELDDAKRAQLYIKMNDLIVKNNVHISLVNRSLAHGRAKTLQNINLTTWDVEYWNIANWTRQG